VNRYPNYKDSGIEWLGEIPKHWEALKLKYLSSINSESLPETTAHDYLMNYIEISDVSEETGIKNKVEITFGSAPSRARRIVKEKDIILSTVRTYLKAIALISNSIDNQIVSTGFAVIRINKKKISPLYSYYAIRSDQFLNRVVANSSGVSYPAINSSSLADFSILVPSKDEQCAIEKYLLAKTQLIETLIEKKQKLIDLLKEYRTAIINEAVTKGLDPNVQMKDSGIEWLGEVPEHWQVKRLKFIGTIKYGLGQPPKTLEDGLPLIRATNIERGKINEKDLIYVDPEDIPYERDPVLKENDIIVVRSGAYTADSAIIPKKFEGAITGYDLVVRVLKDNPVFISYCLLSVYVLVNQLYLLRMRAAQPHLNREELGDTIIYLPPHNEQNQIIQDIDTKTNLIEHQIEKEQNFIEYLKEYRTALISEVVTGKVKVTPDD
jgi:type I restriction enzyme, S subunit